MSLSGRSADCARFDILKLAKPFKIDKNWFFDTAGSGVFIVTKMSVTASHWPAGGSFPPASYTPNIGFRGPPAAATRGCALIQVLTVEQAC
jgi:hypothetical protein